MILILILCSAYMGALWLVFKIPKTFTNVLEERATSVSVITSVFGAVVAILIAVKFFTAVKVQISEFYSKIDHLKQGKMVMDEEKMKKLGLGSRGYGIPRPSAVMRYPAGCIKRERERLARIFAEEKPPEKIASAILDNSLDDKVFKWNGPEVPLDDEPVSYEEREKRKNEDKTSG
jgi:rRNA processing protein Gar1